MSSPDIAPAGNNGKLGANGHDEKPDLTSDSPDEMSDDGESAGNRSEEHSLGDVGVNGNGAKDDSEGSEHGFGDELDDADEDTDEEEDEEPALKYERIGGIQDLLKKDSASALAISNKLLVNTSANGDWVILFIFWLPVRRLEHTAVSCIY